MARSMPLGPDLRPPEGEEPAANFEKIRLRYVKKDFRAACGMENKKRHLDRAIFRIHIASDTLFSLTRLPRRSGWAAAATDPTT